MMILLFWSDATTCYKILTHFWPGASRCGRRECNPHLHEWWWSFYSGLMDPCYTILNMKQLVKVWHISCWELPFSIFLKPWFLIKLFKVLKWDRLYLIFHGWIFPFTCQNNICEILNKLKSLKAAKWRIKAKKWRMKDE